MREWPVDPTNSPREPVAREVLLLAERLAAQAQTLAEMVNVKLCSVMHDAVPRADAPSAQMRADSWPPLFDNLRTSFRSIEDGLTAINDALARTEL